MGLLPGPLLSAHKIALGVLFLIGNGSMLSVTQSEQENSDTVYTTTDADDNLPHKDQGQFKARIQSGSDEQEAQQKPALRDSFVDWGWQPHDSYSGLTCGLRGAEDAS